MMAESFRLTVLGPRLLHFFRYKHFSKGCKQYYLKITSQKIIFLINAYLCLFIYYAYFLDNKCFCTSPKEEIEQKSSTKNRDSENFRFKYHDFLPWVGSRNAVREKLERRDMLRRRNVVNLPEFYVGSILAVTTSNQHASNKSTRFVGICIMKQSAGLSSQFLLRNIVDHQGVEILYRLYSPVIQKIEVLRLEKRLDEELFYLRDAPNEYSEFPFDMQPEHRDETQPVPINLTKVVL